jgi:hypothetical protein
MWTNKESQHLLWQGTLEANKFVGDGSELTGITAGASAIDDLTDVALSSPANGEFLKFDGANWINAVVGAGSETDPVWAAQSGAYLKTANLAASETDPIWMAQSGAYLKTADLAASETDPIFVAASAAFLKTESDPIWTAASAAYNAHIASSAIHYSSAAFTTHIASSAIHQASCAFIAILGTSGAVIASGAYVDLFIPFSCALARTTILANASGSLNVNIGKSTYSTFPTFTAVASHSLVTASAAQISVTGSIVPGDILRFIASGAATSIAQATIALEARKV